jgi:fumarate hydratase class II
MGDIEVPFGAMWGASTQRAINNFGISGSPVSTEIIRSLALIKASAAKANAELGVIEETTARAIASGAMSIWAGGHAEQFPVDRFQTGSGTSTNMNVNEVIAHLASSSERSIHPNDDVNCSQSSNDVFPTAIHLAVALLLRDVLGPAVADLIAALDESSAAWADVVKPGRTHLMDAAPVTLGQEFDGFAGQLRQGVHRITAALPRLLEVPLGGTAVGTGLNAPAGFADAVLAEVASQTGVTLTAPTSRMEAQSNRDALVETSGVLRTIALSLVKICNDLRWMNSGPHAGLAEISLPAIQPGSSIMPGKVNPVIPEAVIQACYHVVGLDAAVALGATTSAFQLNTAMPLMGCNVADEVRLLAASANSLAQAVSGISINADSLAASAERSPAVATSLNLLVGYERAAQVVKDAAQRGITIREAAMTLVRDGSITEDQLNEALDVNRLARGDAT